MILQQKISDGLRNYSSLLKKQQYLKINLIFAGVIVLVIAYSGIFSPEKDNYPVVCIHQKLTGEPCFSCGLSHSFSLIVRGRVAEAYDWNIYGMQVFLFFFLQLILRIYFSFLYTRHTDIRGQIVLADILSAVLLFTISFYPFLKNLVLQF